MAERLETVDFLGRDLEEKNDEEVDFLVLEFAVREGKDKRNEIPEGKGNKKLGGGNGMNGMEKSEKEGEDHCD
ncbi:hypothetical protein ACFX13_023979 [Malus domestica]